MPINATRSSSRKVLLIEDQSEMRRILALTLLERGREIVERSDGPGALEALASERPDLAIVDVDLPGFDGLTMLARVRSELPHLETRFIFLSASATPENRQRGVELGATAFLAKPFAPLELLRLVERTLRDS
jgi:CheY-like chemotaxis protein